MMIFSLNKLKNERKQNFKKTSEVTFSLSTYYPNLNTLTTDQGF